jgi:tRNA(Ile)-lysidine synthase
MRTPFEQRALTAIRRARVILPGSRVGVAVSGGGDSVALLRLLASLRDEFGITLLVVHLNHSLRASESDADARFVENLARQQNLPFVLHVEDVAAVAEREGWNLEDAGRRLRRGFFERLVKEGLADLIAVAHTADDQAETLLAHVMRGTGTTGLGGIHPVAWPLVRPLLEMRRQDLRDYLRWLKQDWREDSTNDDTRRMRARIRKDLLPIIERGFSPGIVGHLNELARFAREEEDFWNALVEERFQELSLEDDRGVRIGAENMLNPLSPPKNSSRGRGPAVAGSASTSLPSASMRALTERLIRRLYEAVRGDHRELSAKHVRQIIELAENLKSGHAVELPRGIVARRELGEMVFTAKADRASGRVLADETPARAHAYQYVVAWPMNETTIVSVAELGKRLSLNLVDWPNAQSDTIWDTQTLDADLLRAPVILRNWRPGDSYRPRGRRDARKLKQMMLAERVPASQRGTWPVLESGGQVVWALGMTPADEYSAKAETRKGLLILEEKGQDKFASGNSVFGI